MEAYLPIKLPPGFRRSGTAYESKGFWYTGNLVRFHGGTVRPVGGWVLVRSTSGAEIDVVGFPRGAHSWRKNDATAWIGVGTTGSDSRLYAFSAGVLTDITPAGLVDGAADGDFVTGSGGWGDGGWGDGPWGGASPGGVLIDADSWALDNFGEVLVSCLTADGKLYSSTPTTQAAQIAGSPTSCRSLVVTPERFLFALGAGGDPRLVQWPSQETLTTWTPGAGNSAGDFPLQTNGRLICGRRTARETLLFTDADLWGAVYVGGRFIYSFQQRGDNCGIIGPNAVTVMDGVAFWMTPGGFNVYDGSVRPLVSPVSDYVFGSLNMTQRAKIQAVPVSEFGEVWFYYPSAGAVENDRYAAVNRAGQWITGSLDRAAGVGAGVFAKPTLFAPDGKLYTHETGNDRGGQIALIESGPIELGEGDRVYRWQKLIPDERILGQVRAKLFTSFEPTETETEHGPFTIAGKTDVRATGRQVRLRLEENIAPFVLADGSEEADGDVFASGGEGQDWRIGTFRAGVIPGGAR